MKLVRAVLTLCRRLHQLADLDYANGSVDVEEVIVKLPERYGENVAKGLEEHIIRNMPDYEYLKQFAVRSC